MNELPLFSSLNIKSITLRNRIVLSPMCQYKAKNGLISDWHLQHYSRFAFSGLGAAFVEATGVTLKVELVMDVLEFGVMIT